LGKGLRWGAITRKERAGDLKKKVEKRSANGTVELQEDRDLNEIPAFPKTTEAHHRQGRRGRGKKLGKIP